MLETASWSKWDSPQNILVQYGIFFPQTYFCNLRLIHIGKHYIKLQILYLDHTYRYEKAYSSNMFCVCMHTTRNEIRIWRTHITINVLSLSPIWLDQKHIPIFNLDPETICYKQTKDSQLAIKVQTRIFGYVLFGLVRLFNGTYINLIKTLNLCLLSTPEPIMNQQNKLSEVSETKRSSFWRCHIQIHFFK